jgi:uncharacterized protein
MKLRNARIFFAGLIPVFVLAINSFVLALDVPPLRGRVTDLAGLMPPDRAQALQERLAAFERETGHQITVLTIPSLQGDVLENFSIRVAEAWKIGQKGFDNGAILLIVRDDRKLRIEVGYGLEGVLPDAIANRIIREVIVPRFRDNDYPGGIEAGVNAILQVTKGEPLPENARSANRGSSSRPSLLGALTLTAILALLIGMLQGRLIRGAFGGAAAGLVATLLSAGAGLGLAVIVGAVLGAIGSTMSVASSGNNWTGGSRTRRGGWGGGWYGGGGFGGGGFGGGGGGGGFSGGGGGFGGGGASGSW